MNKRRIQKLLASADILINGHRPWDIHVIDERLYNRIIWHGSLGLGEAYMDGWWETAALDRFFYRLLKADLDKNHRITPRAIMAYLIAMLANMQNPTQVRSNIKHHYDIGNDLYRAMLDKRMVYTGAFWDHSHNLNEAQELKLEMVCQKLGLQPGQRILDIGCGWGSFAKYAAESYGVTVVGINISPKQIALGRQICQGLPVEIRFQDYRDLNEKFDHIVSLGMFEHVGHKNYRTFMKKVFSCLADDGMFLLQTIGSNVSVHTTDSWISKYIFPNSMLPSIKQISRAMEGLFVMEDWHNFGVHYDKTLMAWFQNFDKKWTSLKDKYTERFYRMWKYYLLSCAGAFRSRKIQLWQIALSKEGLKDGFSARSLAPLMLKKMNASLPHAKVRQNKQRSTSQLLDQD